MPSTGGWAAKGLRVATLGGALPHVCARRRGCSAHKQVGTIPAALATRSAPLPCPPRCSSRVYIVDGEGRAVGVVTPTDALRIVTA